MRRFLSCFAVTLSFCLASAPVISAQSSSDSANAGPEARTVVVSGVTLTLPVGWASDPTTREQQGSLLVVAEERADTSAYRGARITVEVVPGLNRLQQERWLRGQLLRGLDSSYRIEPADRALLGAASGAAVSYAYDGRRGYALYTRGGSFYALRIDAPRRLWSDD
ncbi:MAG: hypothetical protein AAGG50_12635, partial [Bacteroidota bacterium]